MKTRKSASLQKLVLGKTAVISRALFSHFEKINVFGVFFQENQNENTSDQSTVKTDSLEIIDEKSRL